MIRVYTLRNRIVGSSRVGGKLLITDLAPVEYLAFCKAEHVDTVVEAASAEPDPNAPGWFVLSFVDYDARKSALENHPDVLFEADVSPAKRYMVVNDIRLADPLRCYVDIETDSRVPVRIQAEEAPGRILAVTVKGDDGRTFSGVIDEDCDRDEIKMLADMWAFIGQYDQVAAWNGDGFDFPVLSMRSERFFRGKNRCDAFWEARRRVMFIDQLECFKRHHMAAESGDDKTSLKLESVAMALLGEGKHDFNARKTWESWAEGGAERQRMVDYCMQDTCLLPKIEEATGYLALQQTLAQISYTPADSHGLKPMPQFDGHMLRQAFNNGTHLPSKKPPTGDEKEYEGAYVMLPTDMGVIPMVHVCDFKSLYPTVIRSLNLGHDTKGELGCLAYGTDIMFGVDKKSMLSVTMEYLMDMRNVWKKKAKADPDDKYAERMNKAYKIACNSGYGVIGSAWFRLYDREIAESITLGAQALIRATKTHAESKGWKVIYIDTDSLFVTGPTVEEFKAFCDECNKTVYPKMLADRGANLDFNCIELDYEKCFKRLVFPMGKKGLSAKRYFGSYEHYAFKPKSKPEIRGLEYMRADSVRLARHWQKEGIDRILNGASDEQMEEWLVSKRQKFMTQPVQVEDIAKSQGISRDLAAYKTSGPHVRIAKDMAAAGEDVSAGTRISYVVVDGSTSPSKVINADAFDGVTFDRHYYWNDAIYPCLLRILSSAFPVKNWRRWVAKRPKPVLPGQTSLF